MSKLHTTPVFACRGGCGKMVTFPQVTTAQSDPDGEQLNRISANLHKIAICKPCRRRQEYAAQNPGSVPVYLSSPKKEPIRILRVNHG